MLVWKKTVDMHVTRGIHSTMPVYFYIGMLNCMFAQSTEPWTENIADYVQYLYAIAIPRDS